MLGKIVKKKQIFNSLCKKHFYFLSSLKSKGLISGNISSLAFEWTEDFTHTANQPAAYKQVL